jgi:hypothetical protein
MRTKTLLLTAALGLAGISSLSAQVYSVNAVGYVNVNVPKGFSMIANPLVAASNKVPALFATAPEGTILYKFNNATGAYDLNSFEFGEWSKPNDELLPGDGAFINSPSAFTVTFVGEVKQGELTTPVPKGFSIKSSQVPQAGHLEKDLGYAPTEGDAAYFYRNATGAYDISSYEFGEWSAAPNLQVGEAFFMSAFKATDWKRSFSVNK